ncbi:hypothetical protein C1H46_036727 [Malus baccata]|uniref:Uncharacterized protein n=1 Tax=Malus baccata TaxID=106549 RepID=A0A540KUS5_MALBA|nr:hypothetical protein C1H46_036727 [Malus baccata]
MSGFRNQRFNPPAISLKPCPVFCHLLRANSGKFVRSGARAQFESIPESGEETWPLQAIFRPNATTDENPNVRNQRFNPPAISLKPCPVFCHLLRANSGKFVGSGARAQFESIPESGEETWPLQAIFRPNATTDENPNGIFR